MRKKRGWSEKKKDWFGKTYIQHYNADGKKSGTSERKKDWFGKAYSQHYKPSGRKAGTSEKKKDWFGKIYTQKYNVAGKKRGTSEKKEDLLGSKYTQHYNSRGRATDRSEMRTGLLGGKYMERYGNPVRNSSSYPSTSTSTSTSTSRSPTTSIPENQKSDEAGGSGWLIGLIFSIILIGNVFPGFFTELANVFASREATAPVTQQEDPGRVGLPPVRSSNANSPQAEPVRPTLNETTDEGPAPVLRSVDAQNPGPEKQAADAASREHDRDDLPTKEANPSKYDTSIPQIVIEGSLAKTIRVSDCKWDPELTCRITYTGHLPMPEAIFAQGLDVNGAPVGLKGRLVHLRLAPGETGLATFTFDDTPGVRSRVVLTGSWARIP